MWNHLISYVAFRQLPISRTIVQWFYSWWLPSALWEHQSWKIDQKWQSFWVQHTSVYLAWVFSLASAHLFCLTCRCWAFTKTVLSYCFWVYRVKGSRWLWSYRFFRLQSLSIGNMSFIQRIFIFRCDCCRWIGTIFDLLRNMWDGSLLEHRGLCINGNVYRNIRGMYSTAFLEVEFIIDNKRILLKGSKLHGHLHDWKDLISFLGGCLVFSQFGW